MTKKKEYPRTVDCCPLTFKKKKINIILTMAQTLTLTQKKV